MDGISLWAIGVSCCAVVVCITEMLVSDTALEKTVRYVLGAVMLSAVLLPLGGLVSDIAFELPSADTRLAADYSGSMEQVRESYLKSELCALVYDTLKESGIEPREVSIAMDIDEDMSISMITAEIKLDRRDAESAAEVSAVLKEKLGIVCRTVIV